MGKKIKKFDRDEQLKSLQSWMVRIGERKVKGVPATKGKRQASLKSRSNKRK